MKIYRVLRKSELAKLNEKSINTGEKIQKFDDGLGVKKTYSGKDIQNDLSKQKYFFLSLSAAINYAKFYNREDGNDQCENFSILCINVPVEVAKKNLTGDYYALGSAATGAAETIIPTNYVDEKIRKGNYQIIQSEDHVNEFDEIFDGYPHNRSESEKKLANMALDIRLGRTSYVPHNSTKHGENLEFDAEVSKVMQTYEEGVKITEKHKDGLG